MKELIREPHLWGARRSIGTKCFKWQGRETISTKKRGGSPKSKDLVLGVNSLQCNATKMAADWIYFHADSIRVSFASKRYESPSNLFRHLNAKYFEHCATIFHDLGYDYVDGIIRYNYDDLHEVVETLAADSGIPFYRVYRTNFHTVLQSGGWNDLLLPRPLYHHVVGFWVMGRSEELYGGRVEGSAIVTEGQDVVLEARPFAGWQFTGWRLDQTITIGQPLLIQDGRRLRISANNTTFLWADFARI